jgi:arylsulfatase A-like enzyme
VTRRPNVLFITLDQFRADCLSASGHPVVRTPHLDRLARRGVLFANHASQAAPCGPGRACLYTGTYQMTNRVVFNGTPLDARFDNLALAARRAGYVPTLFGYTDQAVDPRVVTEPDDPRLATYEGVLPGFEIELDLTGSRAAWSSHVAEAGFPVPDDPDAMLAGEPERPAELGISAFLTDRFIEWLHRQEAPWFAHLSHLRPHPPYAAAGRWATAFHPDDVDLPDTFGRPDDGFRHPLHDALRSLPGIGAPEGEGELRRLRAQYYGMIGDVDEQVGRTLDALAEAGQRDDTVVIVTSDHGELLGDHGLLQKLGWWEGAYRVPAIISDPRRPDGHGGIVDLPTENVDIFPTVCELLDLEAPAQCDGTSLTPLLGAEPQSDIPGWRTSLTWEFDWRAIHLMSGRAPSPADRSLQTMSLAVRRSSDTAYVHFGDGTAVCFDLAADPHWMVPVDDPARVLAAAQDMLGWRARHLDRTLADTLLHGRVLGRVPEPAPWRDGLSRRRAPTRSGLR